MDGIRIEPRVTPRSFWPVAVAEEILRRVALGESVVSICGAEGFPTRQTFSKWIREDADLAARYLDAQQRGLKARFNHGA
jgi:hypothetical protein